MLSYETMRPRTVSTPEVEEIVETVAVCYQCGTCSGSCPVVPAGGMDYTPRAIMRMLQAGMEDEVLSSETIWTCATCFSCAVRCPREIDITEVMMRLRNLALTRGHPARTNVGRRGRIYNWDFMQIVRRFGRMYELELVLRYHLRTNPLNLLGMAPIGLTMFLKHKLKFLPSPAKGRKEVRDIFDRLEDKR
jgi:heterodisulfide reductase subunit C